jgi:cysteine desulfurase
MSGSRTYLDWNASAPLLPEARQAMLAALDVAGNPSSVHAEGRSARRIIEEAREAVAELVGARSAEVVFTSGATEANNLALAQVQGGLAIAATEHPSVLEPARSAPARLTEIACHSDGRIDAAAVGQLADGEREPVTLASIGLANGETGVLQPIAELRAALPTRVHLHCDAAQACGRIAVSMKALGADYLSISAHKFGGPKGAGALVVADDAPLAPLLRGGGQERYRRAGTENVLAIAGFGAAARAAIGRLAAWEATRPLRDRLEREVLQVWPAARIAGGEAARLPNTSCLILPGRSSEVVVAALDLEGVAVSAGAACSSGKVSPSHVLAAMGVAPELARSAIRISIGPETTEADITRLLAALATIAPRVAAAA